MEFKTYDSIEDLFAAVEGLRARRSGLTPEDVEGLTSGDVLLMATAAAAGAQNNIKTLELLDPTQHENYHHAKDFLQILAEAKQEQARVWLEVHDRMMGAEARAEAGADAPQPEPAEETVEREYADQGDGR